jgi:hypothetical protein
VGQGLPKPSEIRTEMERMRDVLMGRREAPVHGILALMEVADAYFARACEWEQLILAAEADGRVPKGKDSKYHSLRTQEIRSFKELAKSACDLGSRRLTAANLRHEQESRGRESA